MLNESGATGIFVSVSKLESMTSTSQNSRWNSHRHCHTNQSTAPLKLDLHDLLDPPASVND